MKRTLLLFVLILSTLTVWAKRIDVATARRVAETVATQNSVGLRSATDDLSLVYAAAPGKEHSLLRSGMVDGEADFFVFNYPNNKGFVIVSGDDCGFPVMGYADKGSFGPDNLPANLRGMLAFYQKQLSLANRQGIEPSEKVKAEWERYLSGQNLRADKKVVLLETAQWGQFEPFNRLTPQVNEEGTATGCVATAMAIVMNYHKYPSKAVNPPALNHFFVEEKETQQNVTYGAYDWNNMLLDYQADSYNEAQAKAVAELMFHCGANIDMNYGRIVSSAYTIQVAHALTNVFGYSKSIQFLTKDAYRWEEWKTLLRKELDAQYPVVYDGGTEKGEGHAFVCDGYNSDGLFHINWGWNGWNNGFFVLSVLDSDESGSGFSEDQCMILNIRCPELGGEKQYVRPYVIRVNYTRSGNVFNADFDLRYYALDTRDFYLNLGVVDQNNQVVRKPTTSSKQRFENYEKGWMTYSGFKYSFTCSNLSAGQRVALICSEDGINWEVMRTGEQVALGIDNNGVVKAVPDKPVEPEQAMITKIAWNGIDDVYLWANGLKEGSTNYHNVCSFCYQLLHAKDNVTIRYKINDYADWKDHLAVSYALNYGMFKAGKSTKASITEKGYIDIKVKKAEIDNSYYIHYLNLLSDRKGELTYDIQIFTADQSDPVFERKGNKAIFVGEKVLGSISPNPIVGKTKEVIPIAFTMDSNLDSRYIGKNAEFNFSLLGLQWDEVELFYVEGKTKTKIELTTRNDNPLMLYVEKNIQVAPVEAGKKYTFEIVSTAETRFNVQNYNPLLSLKVAKIGKMFVPSEWIDSPITIKAGNQTSNETLEGYETKVWSREGVLHLQSAMPETTYIVTLDGRIYQTVTMQGGHHEVNLPKGVYIIRLGNKSYKVQI